LKPGDKQFCEDMFLLGMLHDFGYEFADIGYQHAMVGGEILKRSGYRYWQEVAEHGSETVENMTDELFILNLADMLTLPDGKSCGINERIAEIAQRYGGDSAAYRKSVKVAEKIRKDRRYKVFFAEH
jgi:hypothetical protein